MTQHSTSNTLLVAPDPVWSKLLDDYLTQNGFAPVIVAPTGASALTILPNLEPRLALIDLRLSDYNVADLCTAIVKAQSTVKVVLIADSDAEAPSAALAAPIAGCVSRTLPLEAWPGLLTYILHGGMAVNYRRVRPATGEASLGQQPPIVIGKLSIDLSQRLATYAGRRVWLTPREFTLLTYLAANPDRIVTVDQLLNEAWGYDHDHGTTAQVRLYITRVRRKFSAVGQPPQFIRNARGSGYLLNSAALR